PHSPIVGWPPKVLSCESCLSTRALSSSHIRKKRADVAEHLRHSTTSAYSLTSPPARPGCSSSSLPTIHNQLVLQLICSGFYRPEQRKQADCCARLGMLTVKLDRPRRAERSSRRYAPSGVAFSVRGAGAGHDQ